MIPSHWFRRIILIVFIMEVAGGILWVTGRLSTNPAAKPMTQALGSLIFLFGFYASAPLSARFLAPRPSRDAVLQERLARIVATVPDSRPVFLYDHADKEANTGFYAGTPENSVIPHCERQSVCCLTCRASNSVGKCLPELPCPLYIVGMQVNRRGRNRRVTQVISYGAQLNPSGDRVGRMGVPHPVRRGPMQLFSQHRMVVLDNLRDEPKKPAHDFPQPQGLDAGIGVVKAANQGRGRIPVSTADRKPPLLQISVQRCAR